MATLALGALGTLIGGPLGGAIGAIAGRQIDSQILGTASREGPRLKELSVTTSSYGAPLGRHFGRMRIAGTIIWATELKEDRETSGGGKGKPKTTEYSYSTSFAVALGSRPIAAIGRIWADGNLLRGSAGDLKAGGQMRFYKGHGDQQVDPLISADKGAECPAFRNCAYVVFEGLQLADFGNRIPALTFEVIADEGPLSDVLPTETAQSEISLELSTPNLTGFSQDRGSVADMLAGIGALYPVSVDASDGRIRVRNADIGTGDPITLPEAGVSAADDDFGQRQGFSLRKASPDLRVPQALRYYDISRDYQPGVQRTAGQAAGAAGTTLEFPGSLAPSDARALIEHAAIRSRASGDRVRWRMTMLDPRIISGRLVRLPGMSGLLRVEGWEWRANGVELDLCRCVRTESFSLSADSGVPVAPIDLPIAQTLIHAFELPWDGVGSPFERQRYVAAGSSGAGWRGAALYAETSSGLESIGPVSRQMATFGTLAAPLDPSPGLLLEPTSSITLTTSTSHAAFADAAPEGLAIGENRLLVGEEIVQFTRAEQIGTGSWQLSGLLRGRGGTEDCARNGHPVGTLAVLLNGRITPLPNGLAVTDQTRLAAIGTGDEEPAFTMLSGAGASLRPLMPVHPRAYPQADGSLRVVWVRRSRGTFFTDLTSEVPLNEEVERYQLGIGPMDSPAYLMVVDEPEATLPPETVSQFAGQGVWVQQVGRAGFSRPLPLCQLPEVN